MLQVLFELQDQRSTILFMCLSLDWHTIESLVWEEMAEATLEDS